MLCMRVFARIASRYLFHSGYASAGHVILSATIDARADYLHGITGYEIDAIREPCPFQHFPNVGLLRPGEVNGHDTSNNHTVDPRLRPLPTQKAPTLPNPPMQS